MRGERPPFQSVQNRARLLMGIQLLAMMAVATALGLDAADVLAPSHRSATSFGIAVLVAAAVVAVNTYLVRGCQVAFRWSLVALGCLSTAPLALAAATNPTRVAGSISLAAMVAMLLSIQASRPSVRACIIEAVGKDIEARMARARALSFAEPDP
jgi:hypothetical protein